MEVTEANRRALSPTLGLGLTLGSFEQHSGVFIDGSETLFFRAGFYFGSHGSLEESKRESVSLLSAGCTLSVFFSPDVPLAVHPPPENVAEVLQLADPPGGVKDTGSHQRRVCAWLYWIVMVVSAGFGIAADAILAPVWRISIIRVLIGSRHHLPALGGVLRRCRSVVAGGIARFRSGMMPALIFLYGWMRKDQIALPFHIRDPQIILLTSITAL